MSSQANRLSGRFHAEIPTSVASNWWPLLYRDSFREMLDSVKPGFAECIQILKENMKLDPYFEEFYNWAKENNVPIVVLSSGMVPIISGLFEELLGHKPDPKHLAIVANDVESRDGKDINTPGGWQIKYHDDRCVFNIRGIWSFFYWRDDSHFGHNKSLEIKPYAALPADKRPILLYAGDGVSDLSAAAETDLLFAKKGHGMKISPRLCSNSILTNWCRLDSVLRARGNAVHRLRGLVHNSCHYQGHLQRQGFRRKCCKTRAREGASRRSWALDLE